MTLNQLTSKYQPVSLFLCIATTQSLVYICNLCITHTRLASQAMLVGLWINHFWFAAAANSLRRFHFFPFFIVCPNPCLFSNAASVSGDGDFSGVGSRKLSVIRCRLSSFI